MADTLKYINSLVNDNPENGGLSGSYFKTDFIDDIYVWGWNNIHKENMNFSKSNVKVTLTPTANLINAGLGFSKTN